MTTMAANEKLTIEALKQHDKVRPSFRPTTKEPPGLSKEQEESKHGESGALAKRLLRVSVTDCQGPSHGQPSPRRNSSKHMSVFKVVHATRQWKRFVQRRRSSPRRIGLENTYRMQPRDGQRFLPGQVEDLIKDVLESRLSSITYSPEHCKSISMDLAGIIKARVKDLNFPRYKIVCNVIIVERKEQGMQIASRCVWNADTDNFATYTYKNKSLVATAYVHGAYFE